MEMPRIITFRSRPEKPICGLRTDNQQLDFAKSLPLCDSRIACGHIIEHLVGADAVLNDFSLPKIGDETFGFIERLEHHDLMNEILEACIATSIHRSFSRLSHHL